MIKEKTGRVTFMPLNRLKPKSSSLPRLDDCYPLLDKLSFDPAYEKAFLQVFGKTCVCKDLGLAAAYVKSHGINTITLDGDKVDRKGALTGGYHDIRRSRIDAINNYTTWKTKHEADSQKSKQVKVAIGAKEQEITICTGRITIAGNQQNKIRDRREQLLERGNLLLKEREKLRNRTLKLEGDINELEAEIDGLKAKLAGYAAEIRAPLAAGLAAEEENLIVDLGQQVEAYRKELVEMGKAKNEVSAILTLILVQRP